MEVFRSSPASSEAVVEYVPEKRGVPSRGNRLTRWLPIFFLSALIPCYLVSIQVNGTGLFHDDGVYLVTAKSLAESSGYRIISLPERVVQTKYPVLFPAILALVWKAYPKFPDNLLLLKLVPACAMLAWLVVTFKFGKKIAGISTTAALWILFFTAGTQWAQFLSTTIMSESLFALLAMSSLYSLSQVLQRSEGRWRELLISAALASAAFNTRSAGIALMLACCLSLAIEKKFRQGLVFAAICAVSFLAWSHWQKQTLPASTSPEAYYTAQNYKDSSVLAAHLPKEESGVIVLLNIFYIMLYPNQVYAMPIPGVNWLVLAFMSIPFWILVARGVIRSPKLMPAYLFAGVYMGMLTVWIWEPSRLMIPLLPILLILAYKGIPNWFPRRIVVPALAFSPLLLSSLFALNTYRHQSTSFADLPWIKKTTGYREPVDWKMQSQVQKWIKENTSTDAVVIASYDPEFFLYTGRRAIRPYLADSEGLFYGGGRPVAVKKREFEAVIEHSKATYLTETGHEGVEDPDYDGIVRGLEQNGRLRLVQDFGRGFRVFQVSAAAATPSVAYLNQKETVK